MDSKALRIGNTAVSDTIEGVRLAYYQGRYYWGGTLFCLVHLTNSSPRTGRLNKLHYHRNKRQGAGLYGARRVPVAGPWGTGTRLRWRFRLTLRFWRPWISDGWKETGRLSKDGCISPNPAPDVHKVLVRWKLDDHQYWVIFGDLRIADVSPQHLAPLKAQ
jgi:hypothetical protein